MKKQGKHPNQLKQLSHLQAIPKHRTTSWQRLSHLQAIPKHRTTSWQRRQIPLGRLLGVVTLTAVRETDAIANSISATERAFGDYTPNRYAWELTNPRPFPTPILYRGHQGLFDVPIAEIRPYLTMEAIRV